MGEKGRSPPPTVETQSMPRGSSTYLGYSRHGKAIDAPCGLDEASTNAAFTMAGLGRASGLTCDVDTNIPPGMDALPRSGCRVTIGRG
eukprot:2365052-Prymnesium_polylepis.2